MECVSCCNSVSVTQCYCWTKLLHSRLSATWGTWTSVAAPLKCWCGDWGRIHFINHRIHRTSLLNNHTHALSLFPWQTWPNPNKSSFVNHLLKCPTFFSAAWNEHAVWSVQKVECSSRGEERLKPSERWGPLEEKRRKRWVYCRQREKNMAEHGLRQRYNRMTGMRGEERDMSDKRVMKMTAERTKRCLTAHVFCAWPDGPRADEMMGTWIRGCLPEKWPKKRGGPVNCFSQDMHTATRERDAQRKSEVLQTSQMTGDQNSASERDDRGEKGGLQLVL